MVNISARNNPEGPDPHTKQHGLSAPEAEPVCGRQNWDGRVQHILGVRKFLKASGLPYHFVATTSRQDWTPSYSVFKLRSDVLDGILCAKVLNVLAGPAVVQ